MQNVSSLYLNLSVPQNTGLFQIIWINSKNLSQYTISQTVRTGLSHSQILQSYQQKLTESTGLGKQYTPPVQQYQ